METKRIIIFLFASSLTILLFITLRQVSADTKSGCFVTKVGNPSGEPPSCLGNASSTTGGAATSQITADGKHACPVQEQYVKYTGYTNVGKGQYTYICEHCAPIINANDVAVNSAGGSAAYAVADGTMEDATKGNTAGGTGSMLLNGDDGRNYYYAHTKPTSRVLGKVKAGQLVGYIFGAAETESKNNGVAHVHISAGTKGNQQSFSDPANVPMGPLLDVWCGQNVCNGQPNRNAQCGG